MTKKTSKDKDTVTEKKKQPWEYAQEARKAKALARAALETPPVKEQKPQKTGEKVKVSTPEKDFNHKVIPINFQRRAGLKNHGQEMVERLQDLEDDGNSDVYYLLPVKLPKKVYKMLLERSIDMSKSIPDWNERDMLEVLVIFSDAKGLTPKKDPA